MQKPGVSRIPSTLNALPQSPYQTVNIKYQKTKVDHQHAFQLAWYSQFSWQHYHPFSDSVIFQMCATANLKGLLHLDLRSKSSFLSMGLDCAKLGVSINMSACYVTNMQLLC